MTDDKSTRAPEDGRTVNRHEDYEVRYWTEKWSVSKDELQRAVSKVGSRADAIARYLGKAA
ncbi:DUF3606 domain-containing protein [Dongia soli]|uniref:DUF3606 domain-containing protein n=1 Tax=Dongia soli TaxID=600628 RepID=A0ABU5EFJ6_9PROT|nr:DUF3606 domain-containing protein [Dongia soli]MDY0884967.1 DUF3606 domain-containing protein [Dongia soli]